MKNSKEPEEIPMKFRTFMIRWIFQTCLCMGFIICAMVFGWGLRPKSWTLVIIFYFLANIMIPVTAYLNYQFDKYVIRRNRS
jgi:predicted membrane protein